MIIKNEVSSLYIEVFDSGYTALHDIDGNTIFLGIYPNARFEVLEEMFKKLKELEKQHES